MRKTLPALALLFLLGTDARATAPLAPATRPESTPAKVRVGDRLKISIFEWKTPFLYDSIEIDVDREGNINLPDYGKIPATNLTAAQLESKISQTVVDRMRIFGTPPMLRVGPEVKVEILPRPAH